MGRKTAVCPYYEVKWSGKLPCIHIIMKSCLSIGHMTPLRFRSPLKTFLASSPTHSFARHNASFLAFVSSLLRFHPNMHSKAPRRAMIRHSFADLLPPTEILV